MKAAHQPIQRPPGARLLMVGEQGDLQPMTRSSLARNFSAGDLLVANDAATLPASLHGIHEASGEAIEIRLAGRPSLAPSDIHQFTAVAFGAGDYRVQTEDRPVPPTLGPGDLLRFGDLLRKNLPQRRRGQGELQARVIRQLEHPRLIEIDFLGHPDFVWSEMARQGRPIQYAHLRQPLQLWNVWTRIAGRPVAFEPPSAGFLLDWKLLSELQVRGVGFATLTLAAGLSSTGEAELDARLPFDEAYHLPKATVRAIQRTRQRGGRVIALGTTVVRALEDAADSSGNLRPGNGVATHRIGPHRELQIVDALISGTHEPGESHYELLRAFTTEEVLHHMSSALEIKGYRSHEFGDSIWVEKWVGKVEKNETPGRAGENSTNRQQTAPQQTTLRRPPRPRQNGRIRDAVAARLRLVTEGFVPGLSSPR
ncbi:MAG: S-adenosylmethionine:tRNA ribosyltransferase-isomerase [Deltaproteobacteria bacterium]|nr:S-adenosylmethionine:tRNA ribosyltransferase-isomerase [Deltaproteobacteria bacterium]